MDKLTLKQTQELYWFLQRKFTPEGYILRRAPRLSKLMAFTVIYVLQEYFQVIPNHFERCKACNKIFDTNCEGQYVERTGSHYCHCQWGVVRR